MTPSKAIKLVVLWTASLNLHPAYFESILHAVNLGSEPVYFRPDARNCMRRIINIQKTIAWEEAPSMLAMQLRNIF